MNKKIKKILKIFSITVVSLIVLLTAVIAVAVNFVFTPEKLTPLIVKATNESLDAKLDIKRVELTFFSTFPEFTLNVEDGNLVSKALRDTLWEKTDTLVQFKACTVVVNPVDFLKEKKISVKNIRLDGARLYAFVDESGKENWNIVTPSDSVKEEEKESDAQIDIHEINLNEVALNQTHLTYDDRNTKVYAQLDSADLHLRAHLKKEHSKMTLEFSNQNLIFWQDGQLLASRLRTSLKADLDLNVATRLLTVNEASLNVNDNTFHLSGTLAKDSVPQSAVTDIRYTLKVPSLATLLNRIPETIVRKGIAKAKGEIHISGQVKGSLRRDLLPTVSLDMQVRGGAFQYQGMPYGIDLLNLDVNAFVDPARRQPSSFRLDLKNLEGAHTRVSAKVDAKNIFKDPQFTALLKSNIDLTALAKTVPLREGIHIEGGIETDCQLSGVLSSIRRKDFGRIPVFGRIQLKKMRFEDQQQQVKFGGDAHFNFVGKDHMQAEVQANSLKLETAEIQTSLEQIRATLRSSSLQDTSRMASIEGNVEFQKLKATSGDSLYLAGQGARAKVSLRPSRKNVKRPLVNLSLDADSLYLRLRNTVAGMDRGGIRMEAEQVSDSMWVPQSVIGFKHLAFKTPELKLPIGVQKTALTYKNQQLKLQNAEMNIGRSNLVASGNILNVYDAWKHHVPLKASLTLTSDNLDGNQLMKALNTAEETTGNSGNELALLDVPADTTVSEAPMKLFVLPANIDFQLKTHFKQASFSNLHLNDLEGDVVLRHQTAYLKNLSMKAWDAEMDATVIYHASQKDRGYTGFDFKLKRVNIGQLVEVVPALDSIMPMLRSFKGIVNFEAQAESQLDSLLNLQIPTLRAAMNIKGDSLVLMDGETFAEISKMLMFKNKKRNLIDSISVNVIVDKGNVTVYPFVIQMDRYRAAVGGSQDLDMNFKYHISVLKSPVPFKLGINISGNLDKMKFRLGKAKYKNQVTPAAILKVDTSRANLGRTIISDFERIMINAKRRNEKLKK